MSPGAARSRSKFTLTEIRRKQRIGNTAFPAFPVDETGEDTKISAVPNALVLFNPALVLAPLTGVDLQGFESRMSAERMGTDPRNLSPAHHVGRDAPPPSSFTAALTPRFRSARRRLSPR
jgi:hypothetical protein